MGIAQLDYEDLKTKVRPTGKARPAITAHACALYARKSTGGQDSTEMQIEEMREYAGEELCVPIYRDGDFEAVFEETMSGLITDRPKYQALRDLARKRVISHVVLWIPSRWGRNTVEFLTAFAELEALGVEVHSTTDGRMTWDKVDEEAYKAKAESITISKRVVAAMRRRARKGEVMQRRPFGYLQPGPNGAVARGVTALDPHAAPIVEELFKRYVEDGESLYSLTEWFNATTGMRKRPFGIRRMLENPFYAGLIVYGRQQASLVRPDNGARPREEWITSTHDHPIVSMEMWTAAQERLEQNPNRGQSRGKEPAYALTGLITCAKDGKRMHGQPDETGKYPFYHCPYCGRSKSQRKIEKALRGLLDTVPVGLEAVGTVALGGLQDNTTRLEEIERHIAKLQARRAKLMARWADAGTLDEEQAVQDAIDLTDRELSELRAKSAAAAREHAADTTIAGHVEWLQGISNWTDLLDDTTSAERNEVYRNMMGGCKVDFAARTLTVEWLPWVARITGQTEQTVAL